MSDLNRQISRLISLLRVECTKSRALKKGKEEPWADTAADGAAGGAATFEVKSFTKSWLTAGFMIAYVYIAGFVLIFLAKAAIGAAVELVARSNAFGLRSAIARERGIEAYRAWLPLERIRPAHIAQEEWEERFAWPANGKPPYPPLTYRMVRAALTYLAVVLIIAALLQAFTPFPVLTWLSEKARMLLLHAEPLPGQGKV
jgi:hypothetical protein